jgi:hypothetical protein
VTKSSNHTLRLHRLTSSSSSTTDFPWLSPTNSSVVHLQFSFLYFLLYSMYSFYSSTPTALSSNQSHIATDGQSISKSWCRAPSGAHDQIFITVFQLRSCFVGRPLVREGGVYPFYMLLVLTILDFLGSESLGTRDHILLSQI